MPILNFDSSFVHSFWKRQKNVVLKMFTFSN